MKIVVAVLALIGAGLAGFGLIMNPRVERELRAHPAGERAIDLDAAG